MLFLFWPCVLECFKYSNCYRTAGHMLQAEPSSTNSKKTNGMKHIESVWTNPGAAPLPLWPLTLWGGLCDFVHVEVSMWLVLFIGKHQDFMLLFVL